MVELDGVQLAFKEVVEYLGLLLTKSGFKGKDPEELRTKCNGALQMILNEPWYNIALQPTHIARSYQTYVRSILLYGAE